MRSATKFQFLGVCLIFHCHSALIMRWTLLRTVILKSSKFDADKTWTVSRLLDKIEIFLKPLLSKIRIPSKMAQTFASNGEQTPKKGENPTIQFPSWSLATPLVVAYPESLCCTLLLIPIRVSYWRAQHLEFLITSLLTRKASKRWRGFYSSRYTTKLNQISTAKRVHYPAIVLENTG